MNTRLALGAALLASLLSACSATVNPDAGDAAADAAGACLLSNGSVCAVGASCPAGDGCNSCSCTAPGMLACTLLACVDASPPTYACGPVFCNRASEFCQRTISDVGGMPDSYTCVALPAACGGSATCTCVASTPCGTQCSFTPQGGLIVTCPGG